MDTWLIIHMPDGAVHTWDLGEVGPDGPEAQVWAARTLVRFAPDDEWVTTQDPSAVMLTVGRPHDSLMDRAVEHDADELMDVDDDAVAAYRARYDAATRQANVDRIRATLDAIDPDLLAEVLAQRSLAAS